MTSVRARKRTDHSGTRDYVRVLKRSSKEGGRSSSLNGVLVILILIFGAMTIWVGERWALSILEGGVFLTAAAAAVRG